MAIHPARRRLTHVQFAELCDWLRLRDDEAPIFTPRELALRATKDLKYSIGDSSVRDACQHLGIEWKHSRRDELEARLAQLEARLTRIEQATA